MGETREGRTSFLPVFTCHLPKRINRRMDIALQHQGEVDESADHVQHLVKIHYPLEMTAFPGYQAVELGCHLLVQVVAVLLWELSDDIDQTGVYSFLWKAPQIATSGHTAIWSAFQTQSDWKTPGWKEFSQARLPPNPSQKLWLSCWCEKCEKSQKHATREGKGPSIVSPAFNCFKPIVKPDLFS